LSKKIIRPEGSNQSEELLSKICDRAFLKLWVYPNPYKGRGDELCDILVIFEKSIFLFSVKDIKFNPDKDIDVAWKRWKNKAIDASMEQISGAERWIKNNPDKVFLDAQCEKKIPINIDLENAKFHRIVVAHGAEDACKNFSASNITGSLAISYFDKIINDTRPASSPPFFISLDKEKVFHVLDSFNLDIILGELDTVTDLEAYFEAKESALKRYIGLAYTGEEDLLANYFLNFDIARKKHFIGTKNKKANVIMIAEGEWNKFFFSYQYFQKKNADKTSYLWDELIQRTAQNAFDALLLGDADVFNGQSAIKEMAKEPRFMRRELAKNMINAIENFPKQAGSARMVSSYPSYHPFKRYVFLQLRHDKINDYDSEYRPVRQSMLQIACGVEKTKRPESLKIVGIAIDAPEAGKGNSEDFILLDASAWSDTDTQHYEEANRFLKFFETDKLKVRQERVFEFPTQKELSSEKRKTGANEPCTCGSGKKFKKCHMNKNKNDFTL
jgi:uncharacterized protein YchJ